MSLCHIIEARFERSFSLYTDLINAIDEATLSSKLPNLPSNTLGLQLWCVVGARESFSRAIKANQWSGFSCSLETASIKAPVTEALRLSADSVSDVLKTIESYTDVQNQLIIDLLEHEAAHHGQLIRYLYGLKLSIPDSWKSKYGLD